MAVGFSSSGAFPVANVEIRKHSRRTRATGAVGVRLEVDRTHLRVDRDMG
jgi:hypothetical protein